MNFSLFQKKSKALSPVYFGLLLSEESGVGYLLQKDDLTGQVMVIDKKQFSYSNAWEHFVEDVDELLYELEQKNNTKVKEVVFFVYSHLYDFQENNIQKPYFEKIKSITTEMDLKSYGYFVLSESIALHLHAQDQAPFNGVIVELDDPSVSISIYKSGKNIYQKSIAKTSDITLDLESIFQEAHKKSLLPSRIIAYDSNVSSSDVDRIISHKWDENVFIQIPRVDVLTDNELSQAVVSNFAKEIFSLSAPTRTVLSAKKVIQKPQEVMGFVIGKDINEVDPQQNVNEIGEEPVNDEYEHPTNPFEKRKKPASFQLPFDIYAIKKRLPVPSKIFVVVAVIVVMFLSIFTILYGFHRATLTILLKEQRQQKELTINASVASNKNAEMLPLIRQKTNVAIEETIATTGEKKIGEKSKGTLTIINKDKLEKIFKKGTKLQTKKGIAFVLDEEVKVASASESITGEGNVLTVTGKTKVKASAADIGTSGNIGKDEKLTVENISENLAFATADSAFSGGSEKEIQTVSKEDLNMLKEKTIKTLKKSAAEKQQNSGNMAYIDDLAEVKLTNEVYTHEVGEEAKSTTLKAEADIVLYGYEKQQIKEIIQKEFDSVLSGDFEIPTETISYSVEAVKKQDDGEVLLTLNSKAGLRKKIDQSKVIAMIKGKSRSYVANLLRNDLQASGYQLTVDTFFDPLKNRVPFFDKNIVIQIKSL